MVQRPNLYYSKIYRKGNWTKNMKFPLEKEKMRPSRHLAQLSIWRGGLGILDTDTNLKCIKKMDSKVIKSHQCLLERSHALSMKVDSEFWSRPSPF